MPSLAEISALQRQTEHSQPSAGDLSDAMRIVMESLRLVDSPTTLQVHDEVTAGSIGDLRILVTANSMDQVKEFIPDFHPRKYLYVHDANQLRGMPRGSILMRIGTYYKNSQFPEIKQVALQRGMRFMMEMDPDQV